MAGVPPGGMISPMVVLTALTRTFVPSSSFDKGIVDLDHLAHQTAGGNHLIALLHRGDFLLVFFSAASFADG